MFETFLVDPRAIGILGVLPFSQTTQNHYHFAPPKSAGASAWPLASTQAGSFSTPDPRGFRAPRNFQVPFFGPKPLWCGSNNGRLKHLKPKSPWIWLSMIVRRWSPIYLQQWNQAPGSACPDRLWLRATEIWGIPGIKAPAVVHTYGWLNMGLVLEHYI